MHQRDTVAALGLVHEVSGEEDGDAIIAGKVDQRAPERVACHRVDARSRFIENEDRRPVQHRHRKLQPLLDAQRQAFRLRIRYVFQIVALQQLLHTPFDLVCGQMIEMRVQLEILPDRKLPIEGERLRHVTDVLARLHVVGAHRLSE